MPGDVSQLVHACVCGYVAKRHDLALTLERRLISAPPLRLRRNKCVINPDNDACDIFPNAVYI